MNQTSPPSTRRFRRPASIIGGAAAGLTAVLMFATPALACHAEISVKGAPTCDTTTGEWVVTWQVQNSDQGKTGKITDVTLRPEGSKITGIVVGATIPAQPNALVGVQRVPGNEKSAELSIKTDYSGNQRYKKTVEFGGTCKEDVPTHSPSASPSVSPTHSAPAVAPSTTASPVSGQGGSLPVTGSSTGTVVGIAAGLLAIGAVLFFVFRHRRVRFTA